MLRKSILRKEAPWPTLSTKNSVLSEKAVHLNDITLHGSHKTSLFRPLAIGLWSRRQRLPCPSDKHPIDFGTLFPFGRPPSSRVTASGVLPCQVRAVSCKAQSCTWMGEARARRLHVHKDKRCQIGTVPAPPHKPPSLLMVLHLVKMTCVKRGSQVRRMHHTGTGCECIELLTSK